MKKKVTPYKDSNAGKKAQVTQMFDTISDTYDGLNRVISWGSDIKWRKKVVQKIAEIAPERILDVATGTGDLAIALTEIKNAHVTGLDISEGMLGVGKEKIINQNLQDRVQMVLGDSENLPFADASFDAATVSFGVRNFEDLEKGLSEILRVIRPGGRLVVLETSVPEHFPFRQGYFAYTKFVMPLIGKIFSKDRSAYAYLSKSAQEFPYGKRFTTILDKVGYADTSYLPQTLGGVATIYIGNKK
ncbi:MAG: bifunctional demethylmenaquinone methyltransferase/2-methoxy-6-polyprenyl-1,4-benzoquinol methylase UbiE [Capnocytophaga sp.]|nr:bifunctional demethylmenaquinone methyltransferase/2-methoxy-6-polyprenyl-1,4-benzoquinol methylase UbiE [Capnocytophaga sp.]